MRKIIISDINQTALKKKYGGNGLLGSSRSVCQHQGKILSLYKQCWIIFMMLGLNFLNGPEESQL